MGSLGTPNHRNNRYSGDRARNAQASHHAHFICVLVMQYIQCCQIKGSGIETREKPGGTTESKTKILKVFSTLLFEEH